MVPSQRSNSQHPQSSLSQYPSEDQVIQNKIGSPYVLGICNQEQAEQQFQQQILKTSQPADISINGDPQINDEKDSQEPNQLPSQRQDHQFLEVPNGKQLEFIFCIAEGSVLNNHFYILISYCVVCKAELNQYQCFLNERNLQQSSPYQIQQKQDQQNQSSQLNSICNLPDELDRQSKKSQKLTARAVGSLLNHYKTFRLISSFKYGMISHNTEENQ